MEFDNTFAGKPVWTRLDENITLKEAVVKARKVCGLIHINITCSEMGFDVEFSAFGPGAKCAGAVGTDLVSAFSDAIANFSKVIS